MTKATVRPPATRRDTMAGLTPGSARSLLFTVLGELTWPVGGSVRTATLVHILERLGIEEQTARQAIARAAASDWIDPERRGREVSWTLSDKLTGVFRAGVHRVSSVSDPYADWDGRWLAVVTSIPHELRAARRPLYAGLRWAGFGDPTPGLWVSPHVDRLQEVGRLIDSLELREHTIAVNGALEAIGIPPADIVARGWDLEAPTRLYQEVAQRLDRLAPTGPDDILIAHIRTMNEWQVFPQFDPQLPEALLPDWIGRKVSRRIADLREGWKSSVRARYLEIESGP